MATAAQELPEQMGQVWLKTSGFTLGHFVNDSYPNLYPALLPVLMVDLHFSVVLAGLLSSIAALTTQLLQPLTGFLADRFGTRWFVVGGLGGGALVASSALAFAPAYWIFLAALLVGGIGNALFHPHASALVGDLTARKKGLSMSFFMIGGNFGRAVAPVAATTTFLLLGRHGLALLAIPGVIMAVILARLLTPAPAPRIRSVRVWTPEFRQGLRHAANLLAMVGLRNLASSGVLVLVPILWHELHRPLAEAAGLLSVMFLAGAFGNMSGGALSDRLGPKPVLIGSAVLSSACLVAFLTVGGPWSWITMAALGFCLFSSSSVVMVYGQALFPNNKGMASGITVGVGNTLGALAVALLGLVAAAYGPKVALMVGAATLLGSIPFTLRLKNDQEQAIQTT
jgi:FSR family fosmidomycin resistance protein-like MFS transporter